MGNLVERLYVAKPELMSKVFSEDKTPHTNKALFKGAVTSPELMKAIVDIALSDLKKMPNEEVKNVITALKTEGKEAKKSEVSEKFAAVFFGDVFPAVTTLVREADADFLKNASSRPIQKEISRLASDSKLQKMCKAIAVAMNSDDADGKRTILEGIKQLESAEGGKFALSLMRKFKLLPKSTIKETLKKVWEAIKAFFIKLFCCCKKKVKDANLNKNVDDTNPDLYFKKEKKGQKVEAERV